MKGNTRIIVSIGAIVGLVFGITYIANYTARDETVTGPPPAASPPPVRFFRLSVHPGPPVGWAEYEREEKKPSFSQFAAAFERGRFQADYEVHTKAHADYWFENPHPQEVKVSLRGRNCQCGGVNLGVIPADAWRDYLQRTAVASLPIVPVPTALAAIAGADLQGRIAWTELNLQSETDRKPVPAAGAGGSQLGIVRVFWTGTQEGPKTITAEILHQLGGRTQSATLEARSTIVPAVRVTIAGGTGSEVRFGDLLAGAAVVRELYCWSTTQPELELKLWMPPDDLDPCIKWTTPERLPEAEVLALVERQFLGGGAVPRCVYRFQVTVREHCQVERNGKTETHHLDLGPFDKRFLVSAGTRGEVPLMLRGIVRGELQIQGATESVDRIDFGPPYPSERANTKSVRIVANRLDLNLELDKDATVPNYLVASLGEPRNLEGRREWQLRIEIPAGKLSGSLPPDSAVVLKTKDTAQRRIRLPVVAKAFDSNRPFD